ATGGVGLALTQYARAAGAHVIASATEYDAALVTGNGAAEAIDYRARAFVDGLKQRYPAGVDVLVDLVSMFDALLASAAGVRDGGILLSTLFGPDPEKFGPRINVIYSRLKAEPGDLARVVEDHLNGRLAANVGQVYGFDQGRDACLALRDGHTRGKLVVTMAGTEKG
ncbi:MAG: zinc-binding dehydrogenase, partial [Sphingomonadaceae bacterium]|nr:zinc-binding dehydrogenase [Sphingomonadaceae bacterium]